LSAINARARNAWKKRSTFESSLRIPAHLEGQGGATSEGTGAWLRAPRAVRRNGSPRQIVRNSCESPERLVLDKARSRRTMTCPKQPMRAVLPVDVLGPRCQRCAADRSANSNHHIVYAVRTSRHRRWQTQTCIHQV
jgi:hypothetical protein